MHEEPKGEENLSLHQRAELQAKADLAVSPEPLSLAEAQKVAHDLRVHQIELEMQNEELRWTQAELEATRARYFDLYDLAPVGYVTLSEQGLIQETNLTAANLLGVNRNALIKRSITQFVVQKEDQDIYYQLRHQLDKTGTPQTCDLRVLKPDGAVSWVKLTATMVQAEIRLVLNEITQRKQAEQALRESETRHRAILQTAMDGFWLMDTEGKMLEVNEAYCRMSGYSEPELLGMQISDLEVAETRAETAAHMQRLLAKGEDRFETLHRRKDGGVFNVEISVQYKSAEGGRLVAFLRDITERKRTEAALRASEEKYRGIFTESITTIYLFDARKNFLDTNQAGVELLGYSREELLRLSIPMVDADPVAVLPAHQELLSGGRLINYEHRLRRKDGTIITVLNNSMPLTDSQGNVVGMVSTLTDITERKQAEAALRASEERFRSYFELPLIGIAITSPEKGWLEVNDQLCAKLGYSRKQLAGMTWVELTHADDLAADEVNFKRVLAGEIDGYRMEKRFLCADGQVMPSELAVRCVRNPDGSVNYFVALVQDITERKQGEEKLERTRNTLLEAQKIAHLGSFEYIAATRTTVWSEEEYRIYGLDPSGSSPEYEEMLTKCIHPNDAALLNESFTKAMQSRSVYELEHRIVRPDGSVRWVYDLAYPYFDERGELDRYVGTTLDITERKRAEEALRASEAEFRAMFEVASIGMAQADPRTGKWLRVNQKICRITGYSVEEMLQLRVPEITHPEDRERDWKMFQEVVRGERPDYHIEKRYVHKNGAVIWVSVNMTIIRDAAEQPLRTMATIEDISERKSLEEQLRQSQKLESIGQLAGGIAHDYNNLLASTMMNLGMLRDHPNLDQEAQETLNELTVEAQRAANLTRQLLLFSRRSIMEVKVLDLNELVANLLKMLGRLLGEHIAIQFNHSDNLPPVEADPGMLEQVLMNLAVNARDAMPKGGRLTFSLETIQVDAERIKGNTEVRPGSFVCLSVTDTGCGMNKAIQKRIFEPFFTTKEVGKGTGLGLATAYGIVAQHKGWVAVESEEGKGSTFRVFLPTTAKGNSALVPRGKTEVSRGHETILVVEDDVMLRGVATRVFLRLGYRVLEAANGQAAMKLWQEQAGQIDLLFSDMVMPEGVTGLDLAEKLRAKQPNLKVIITSGYNAEMVVEGRPTADGIRYLQKPYQIEVLSKVVRECLERKRL